MLTRFSPHSRKTLSMLSSNIPLVVSDKSFKPGTSHIPEMISGRSVRISGSPPVSFIRATPKLTATLAIRTISSAVIFSAETLARFTSPSLWQNKHRLLHR
jgi:hypothetical protein